MKWNFDNTYLKLPSQFFHQQKPTPVTNPQWVLVNSNLIRQLGLEPLDEKTDLQVLAGNLVSPEAEPLAQAYAGHQFGYFNKLGDGRALLLGEHLDPQGQRYDIQLKGSGPTPYSRRGDGRAALGPMLREYIISEAMFALGVPTTRSLAVVSTGESVYRDTVLPGAVLTRVAASHLRVGTFQYAASLKQPDMLKSLADYTIQRHYSDLKSSDQPYVDLIKAVCKKQALLIVQWLQHGFIHGVMNTDNMSIAGETIDYGPCAFMDSYHPDTVFSSIDKQGRYAFAQQPAMAHWNLARFAESLLPLLDTDLEVAQQKAQEAIQVFVIEFQKLWTKVMQIKLGLCDYLDAGEILDSVAAPSADPLDQELIQQWLLLLQKHKADYTLSFRDLSEQNFNKQTLFTTEDFKQWYGLWQSQVLKLGRTLEQIQVDMKKINPSIIPRNHRVEEALLAATEKKDLSVLHRLLAALAQPYDDNNDFEDLKQPPGPAAANYQTFCGT
ncbi:MAG: protein adenylyltransferase SelO [Pseudobdellovibrionaceae bacterium]